ncbi:MAU2 chromatid cohesion factor homolog [Daphnia carinata]|uniref:MAU2 chromatid cohesion factor homolog n=1 Tax=Daphnia carinata TaxID=120202 RepID=UPI00257DF8AC|nr:MAU2 chromatid cohesion factor homolog [Daphnia carinata]
MASTSSQDAWYLALLGLAEHFRVSTPPNIRMCVQCLQTVFSFKPPPRVEARTHLQLGNILVLYTKNIDLARSHLEQAWSLSQNIAAFDDIKYESASLLAELYEQQNQTNLAKPLLRKTIEMSQQNVFWHCRLLFQLAQIHSNERDYLSACGLLGVGADYAHISGAQYSRLLFTLSKCMLLLIDKKFNELHPLLAQVGPIIDNWQGSLQQKEYLKIFFLVLQVCQCLMSGQVKSVKPYLKQLQQSIQTITQPNLMPSDEDVSAGNSGDMFVWMSKEHLCVLVYVVTVMHSMQAGYMDKAQKYTEKAFLQIEKLKLSDNRSILTSFHILLLEHLILCRLVMGQKGQAIREVATAAQLCAAGPPRLLAAHSAQLHTLLGLYAMSMNSMEAAEAQLNVALRSTTDRELWTFANLNLAIVYLRMKREGDFNKLIENINPETLPSHSHSLRAAAFYVQGLQCFFQARYNEAKRYLRETLKMANAEDLNRLTSCSLVLLGHIFLSLGNSREAMNMVTPAMQLASKIPDVHIQLWASAILKDLYRMCGDGSREAEAYQTHANFSQLLMKDNYASHQSPEHALITWIEQPLTSFLQLGTNNVNSLGAPSTSNMIMPTPGSSSLM